MISRRHHDEYALPYLNQLAGAFGGLYIHSCGNWLHQMPSLEKVHNLRGLEFGASETPFAPVFEHFNGRVVLACRIGLHRETKFDGMADYVRRILARARRACSSRRYHEWLIDDTWPKQPGPDLRADRGRLIMATSVLNAPPGFVWAERLRSWQLDGDTLIAAVEMSDGQAMDIELAAESPEIWHMRCARAGDLPKGLPLVVGSPGPAVSLQVEETPEGLLVGGAA
jgi:hypothetical protein